MGLFSSIGRLFRSPQQNPALGQTNFDLSNLQTQLNNLAGQTGQLNPNAPYTPTAGENQYLNDIASRVSSRFANLGLGDSPLVGGQIANDIAPALSDFRQRAFQNQLESFGARSHILGSYYNDLLNRQQILQSQRKQPWWKQLISPALTAAGYAFGGPIGGAVGGAIGNSLYTPPPQLPRLPAQGGFTSNPASYGVNLPGSY